MIKEWGLKVKILAEKDGVFIDRYYVLAHEEQLYCLIALLILAQTALIFILVLGCR